MAKALVLYHSQDFGNTGKMAQAVADGLRNSGCEVDLFNTNDGRLDITRFAQYDCVAFGSPDYYSYIAGGLKVFLDDHFIADVRRKTPGLREKPFALFVSHGNTGKVKELMPKLFARIGMQVGELVWCTRTPDEGTLAKCRELGRELGKVAGQRS